MDWTTSPHPVGACQWQIPPASRWPPDDLVLVGADLAPSTVVAMYRHGLFPMGLPERGGAMGWWSPMARGVLPLDRLRVTRSLRQSARRFTVRFDTDFDAVLEGCADRPEAERWIDARIAHAYRQLHQLGWAHSVEVYDAGGVLAGGLYGFRVGRLFAGESMFHRQRDASKVALVALVERMQQSGLTLLDTQWETPHLASLGVVSVSRAAYLRRLREAVADDRHHHP